MGRRGWMGGPGSRRGGQAPVCGVPTPGPCTGRPGTIEAAGFTPSSVPPEHKGDELGEPRTGVRVMHTAEAPAGATQSRVL